MQKACADVAIAFESLSPRQPSGFAKFLSNLRDFAIKILLSAILEWHFEANVRFSDWATNLAPLDHPSLV